MKRISKLLQCLKFLSQLVVSSYIQFTLYYYIVVMTTVVKFVRLISPSVFLLFLVLFGSHAFCTIACSTKSFSDPIRPKSSLLGSDRWPMRYF